jgi:membrane fusion protein (multidrug efflux system)
MKRSYWAVLGIALAVLLLIALGFALFDGESAPQKGFGGMPAMPVEVARVKVGTVESKIEAVGTLASAESVMIQPEVAGKIAEIAFQDGQQVKKGDVLVRLDASLLAAELADRQAAAKLSKANHARTQQLAAKGIAALRTRDEALAKMESDRAQLQLARVRYEKATLRAPFDGIVGLRRVSLGEYVEPGDDIVNLESIDSLKVEFRISEIYLPDVKVGQSIAIEASALPGKKFDGEVYAVDPHIDVDSRAIRLRARVANPQQELAPGLFVRVSLRTDRRPNALIVPEAAIVPNADGSIVVYVVREGQAKAQPVKLGERMPGEVEIREGLKAGDIVVRSGQIRLQDAVPVEIVNEKPPARS